MLSRRALLPLLAAGLALPRAARAGLLDDEAVEPIHTLRLSTMCAADSPWGRVLNVWARAAEKATEDRLRLDVVTLGGEWAVDEADLIERLLEEDEGIVSLSAGALATLAPAAAPFAVPGLHADAAALDAARAEAAAALSADLAARGLMELTWGHEGRRALLTRGVTARGPSDLAGAPIWAPPADPIAARLIQALGAVPVSAPLEGVARLLDRGELAAVIAPLLQARSMGWLQRVEGLVDAPLGHSTASVVCRAAVMEPLEAFVREALLTTAPTARQALGRRIHELDALARDEARASLNAPALAQAHLDQWAEVLGGLHAGLRSEGLIL